MNGRFKQIAASAAEPKREFVLTTSKQVVVFSADAVRHMLQFRQNRAWHRESGGQLFGKLSNFEIFVVEATGPRASDVRTRISYKPDRRAEQVEIDERFQKGLIYLGDWHTHPELRPTPSTRDSESMVECFSKSKHSLTSFMLVVVGSKTWNESFVALYDSKGIREVIQGPAMSQIFGH